MIAFFLLKCVPETPTIKPRFFISCWSFHKHRHKSPAGLSIQRQFPPCCCIYHRTFLYQNMQHTHIHKPPCTLSLLPVHAQTHSLCSSCLYCPCPLPSFSFSSSLVCITGSHRRFLVLNRDILAPDSRSLTCCSSCPWFLYWGLNLDLEQTLHAALPQWYQVAE